MAWRDGIDTERLDAWITGNYGQDQYDDERDPEPEQDAGEGEFDADLGGEG